MATENTGKTEGDKKRAEASKFLPIVRGRLPLLFVHAIRFDKVVGGMGTKEVASAFGTSVGKVFDIRKNRNFGYVTEAYKPTADDVAAAKAWIEQVGGQNAKGLVAQGDSALMSRIVGEYERRGLASADEAKAFAEARTATRTKPEKKAPTGAKPADKPASPQKAASLLA